MEYNKIGIYLITNIKTGKFYLGKSINLGKRKICHLSSLRNNKHHNKHLQHSWNKYGEECFVFEVLEYIKDTDLLNEVEQFYIDDFNLANDKEKSYNMAEKSKGVGLSGEKNSFFNRTAEKHPDSIRVVKVNTDGEVCSTYHGLSEAARRENVSESCISECCSGKQKTSVGHAWFYEDYYNKNKNEIDFKSFFKRGRSRAVTVLNSSDVFMYRFDTIREAANKLDLNEKRIQECCAGRRSTHRGYKYIYEEKYLDLKNVI